MKYRRFVKEIVVIWAILFFSLPVFAAFELLDKGVVSGGMGGAGCARPVFGEYINSNPANQAFITTPSFVLAYRRLYDLKELQNSALALVYPLKRAVFSLKIFDFGDKLYHENAAAFSAAIIIMEGLALGVQSEIYHISIKDNGSAFSAGIDVGFNWKLADNLSWGASASNLNEPVIGACREKLPVIVQTGVSYRPVNGVELCADIYKDDFFPPEIRAGVEYSGLRNPVVRVGFADQPASFAAGLEFDTGYFRMAYALNTHNYLGLTHTIGLFFRINRYAGEDSAR